MYSSLLVVSMLISQTSGRLVQGRRVFYDPRIYNSATAVYRGPFDGVRNRPASEQVVLHSAQFMMWLNDYRRERGLQPVDYALYLEAAAQGNNVQQVLHGTGHYTVSSSYRECVCRRATWEGARDAWLAEPSNRAVLISPTLKRIGIAEYRYSWTLAAEDVESLGEPRAGSAKVVAVPPLVGEAGYEPMASHDNNSNVNKKRYERDQKRDERRISSAATPSIAASKHEPPLPTRDRPKSDTSRHERTASTHVPKYKRSKVASTELERLDPPVPTSPVDALAGLR